MKIDLLNSKKKVKIIDIRSSDEFNNLADRPWKKIGKLKNSVNLQPIEASLKSCEIPKEKDAIIYVYGSDEATLFCKMLSDKGYKNVYCLSTSFWSFIYTYANVPGFESIKGLMENYEGLY